MRRRSSRSLRLKFFILLGLVAFFGLVFVGSLVIATGVSASKTLISKSEEIWMSPTFQHHKEEVQTELKKLSTFDSGRCWTETRKVFSENAWQERSLYESYRALEINCFSGQPKEKLNFAPAEPTSS